MAKAGDNENMMDVLRASALGAELAEEELQVLYEAVDVRTFSSGEILISEGNYDDQLYALASGRLEVYRAGEGGSDTSLQTVEPGQILGELAFLEGLKRTASVRAKEESCVISLRRESIESLIESHPWVVYKVMRAVVRSAHGTVRSLDTAYADMVHYVSG
jgi:CRP-like cAMP-binding protein